MSLGLTDQIDMLPEEPPNPSDQFEIQVRDFEQDQTSVFDYFRKAEAFVDALQGPAGVADRDGETKLVTAFVEGLNNDFIRQTFESYVEEYGFSWRNISSHVNNLRTVAEQLQRESNLIEEDKAVTDRVMWSPIGQAAAEETERIWQTPSGQAAKRQATKKKPQIPAKKKAKAPAKKKRQLAPDEPGIAHVVPKKKQQRVKPQTDPSMLRRSTRVAIKRGEAGI